MLSAELLPCGRIGAQPALQPWVASPYRLVSLLEMLEFNAARFVKLTREMSEFRAALMSGPSATKQMKISEVSQLHGNDSFVPGPESLAGIERVLKSIGLDFAIAHIERISAKISEDCTLAEVESLFQQMQERVEDELKQKLFLHVLADKTRFYSEKDLFGAEVNTKFPVSSYDIAEAGKCLALRRATATVFHVMRVLEKGVQALAAHLSITIGDKDTWGTILGNVKTAIGTLGSGKTTDQLKAIHASLHAVKEAWRDTTMHPKLQYTDDEAEAIFTAAKIFMQRLAQIV